MYAKSKKTMKAFLMTTLSGMLMILSANAQTGAMIDVRGTVKDIAGEPIIGANILVQGTSLGTITDYDGNFSLQAPADGTLEISYIGYMPQSVPINNRTSLQVVMEEDTELLDEVVVIGYGTAKKSDLTGAIAAIDEKDFQKGVITDPTSLITGKVAGVQVISNGGRAGSGTTIRIRGGASLNASNEPLIVIDGMPVDVSTNLDGSPKISGASNPLAMINPNDIESMNILKDASSTAIYGSRASNGVILITTKKERADRK